jgi:aspartyl-tRNA(Asn)/glutamyl-tRNA(Gln) amidotransferase subunit C
MAINKAIAPANGVLRRAGGFASFAQLFRIKGLNMSVDEKMARRIAMLSRIGVSDEQLPALANELSAILGFVEQLSEVDTTDVKPLTSAVDSIMRMRADEVNDGGYPDDILKNAPEKDDEYFAVPKVVE